MDDADRATVRLDLDRRIVDEAKSAGVDVPRVAEELLRQHIRDSRRAALRPEEREAQLRQINDDIAWRNAMIDENGLFGQDWRTF